MKRLWSAKGEGQPIRYRSCADERAEASFVARDIESRHELGVPWSDFCLLYRVNPQSKLFEEALQMRRIPYRIIGSTALFDRAEVRDWVAYLTLLVNPANEMALRRIINVPRRGLGAASIAILDGISKRGGGSMIGALRKAIAGGELPLTGREGAAQFISLIETWRPRLSSVSGADLAAAAIDYLNATGLLPHMRRVERNSGLAERRVDSLLQLTQGMGANPGTRIADWLATVSLDNRDAEKSGDGPEVTLLTLHSAKGLEFPEVYLVGFEQELLPHRRSLEAGEIDEERRLCYVGMTRAMERLTLTAARTRTHRNERMPRKPSLFLDEIPASLLATDSSLDAESESDAGDGARDAVGEVNRAGLDAIRKMLSK